MKNISTNATFLPPIQSPFAWAKVAILLLMHLISLLGNCHVIIRLTKKRNRSSTINYLLLNLAIADLMVSFWCTLTEALWNATVQWYGGDLLCRMVKFLQVFSLYASTYLIVVISVDRCSAVLDPLRHHTTSRRVPLMTFAAWVTSAVLASPQSYIFHVERAPYVEDFQQCVTYGSYTEAWQETCYGVVSFILMYALPLLVMLITYSLIIVTISRKASSHKLNVESTNEMELCTRNESRNEVFRRARAKSIKLTCCIVVAFIVCWTPYQVMMISQLVFGIELVDSVYFSWIFFFGMTNSMFNPIIYGVFNTSFTKKRRGSLSSTAVTRRMKVQNPTKLDYKSPMAMPSLKKQQITPTLGRTMEFVVEHEDV